MITFARSELFSSAKITLPGDLGAAAAVFFGCVATSKLLMCFICVEIEFNKRQKQLRK